MGQTPGNGNPGTSGRGKVARLLARYDLQDVGDELERRWTAVGEEHTSLRDLAAEFNQRILRRAMEEAGLRPVEGEVENAYRVLTGDDVSQGDRTRLERRLEREGIDVDTVRDDFVSYQAVRSYLTRDRDAEYSPDREDQLEKAGRALRKLYGRMETVTRDKIEHLRKTEQFALGGFSVFVDVRIVCNECGEQYQIDELLDAGGCDCTLEPLGED